MRYLENCEKQGKVDFGGINLIGFMGGILIIIDLDFFQMVQGSFSFSDMKVLGHCLDLRAQPVFPSTMVVNSDHVLEIPSSIRHLQNVLGDMPPSPRRSLRVRFVSLSIIKIK